MFYRRLEGQKFQRHHPVCFIVPPHILHALISRGDDEQKNWALHALLGSQRSHTRRNIVSLMTDVSAPSRQLRRTIYDAKHGASLPSPEEILQFAMREDLQQAISLSMKHMIILAKHMNFTNLSTIEILSMIKGWNWFQVFITVENITMHLGTGARWNMEMVTESCFNDSPNALT